MTTKMQWLNVFLTQDAAINALDEVLKKCNCTYSSDCLKISSNGNGTYSIYLRDTSKISKIQSSKFIKNGNHNLMLHELKNECFTRPQDLNLFMS